MSNMADILKNFDNAASGKKQASTVEAGSMKAILESFNKVAECGPMEMAPQGPMQTTGTPVTVSVTASGKENVADLIAMMQQAAGIEQHIDMPMAHDSHIDTDSHNITSQDADMAAMRKAVMGTEEDIEEEDHDGGFGDATTEPDEEYKDHNYMTKDLSGGINRRKPRKAIRVKDPAVESIKDRLWAALNEKKTSKK